MAADGDYRLKHIQPYAALIRARFGPPGGDSMTQMLPAACLRFAAARLLANRRFSRRVVLDLRCLHSGLPALATGAAPARMSAATEPS